MERDIKEIEKEVLEEGYVVKRYKNREGVWRWKLELPGAIDVKGNFCPIREAPSRQAVFREYEILMNGFQSIDTGEFPY